MAAEETYVHPTQMVRNSIMSRLGVPDMSCVFCGQEVEIYQFDWEIDRDFREVCHTGRCAENRRAHHNKLSLRGC